MLIVERGGGGGGGSTTIFSMLFSQQCFKFMYYNPINVYCRELAPGAVSLTGDRAQGDDNKHCRDYILLPRPLRHDPRFIQCIYRYSHASERLVEVYKEICCEICFLPDDRGQQWLKFMSENEPLPAPQRDSARDNTGETILTSACDPTPARPACTRTQAQARQTGERSRANIG